MASQTADAWSGRVMKQPYTSRQGQFLAFIRHYATLHGRPPAEAEMGQFFRLTPPSVHQMIPALERRGLITREPGMARSIRPTLQPEQLRLCARRSQ
ncbi:MAG TPA: MarR family transcriptional regulator [Candidatus Binatia bacterium]|nr:MarR family transcriptional regulator [Candidatus Binatia bacterium]